MNYLELDDVLAIACEVLGLEVNALLHVTDVGLADSAVARPQASFAGQEFHPTLEAKAASQPDRQSLVQTTFGADPVSLAP